MKEVLDKLYELNTMFSLKGFELYLVGGCIRDMLLGKYPKDYDLATNATPEQMEDICKYYGDKVSCLPTGKKYGTVTIMFTDKRPDKCIYKFFITLHNKHHHYLEI